MLDPDKLYFSSDEDRALLDELNELLEKEKLAQRADNSVKAAGFGLDAWALIVELKDMLCAGSIYELENGEVVNYDLLFWASSFADELHNASLIDKSFRPLKIQFCETYIEMHNDMLSKEVNNLGSIRRSLAESYHAVGRIEEADSLFRKWLTVEPDWGWGWIGWSDNYWLMPKIYGATKDLKKAKKILKEGLSVQKVSNRNYLEERLNDLEKAMQS